MPKIICNFTTWKGRDWCVPIMLEHFQKQTVKPDMVLCWLSRDEYEGKVPESIQTCVNKGWITEVKFVEGNTYAHKRYETFKTNNSHINIMIDDDIYYPTDYVEKLVEYANIYKNCVTCYYTKQETYINGKKVAKEYSQEPSHKNRLLSGLSCYPPNTFPIESFDYSYYRDKYCKMCDDSWLTAWLLKTGKKIAGVKNWGAAPLNTIEESQDTGIWSTHNSVAIGGVINACINLSNAIKIVEVDSIAHNLWPEYDFDKYTTVALKVPYKPTNLSYTNGVSVCITAYNADKYIEDAIKSVSEQTYFKTHSNYEIIVGVDGCQKTLDKVVSIASKYKNLRVYMTDRNAGTYLTSNTIISKAMYSHVIRFDSDDIMEPNMVETVMNDSYGYDIVRYDLKNFGASNEVCVSWGSSLFKHTFLDSIGCYRPWVCGGDAELIERTSSFSNTKHIKQVLFKRRVHSESLTQSKETSNKAGSRSSIREMYYRFIKSHKYNNLNDAKIQFLITPSTEIKTDSRLYGITSSLCNESESHEEKLIVTLTTWVKRIGNIPTVLDSILSQTKQADKIVLNLSEEEFSTSQIPQVVKDYLEKHSDMIEVQWIKGPNTKQWKKTLPTMIKYPLDAIVCIDDDATYPSDMLKVLWDVHKRNPGHPVSGFNTNAFNMGVPHCGTCNLDKLEYYGDIFSCLTDEVLSMYSSDIFFTYMAMRAGHKHVWCGRNFISERKTFNEIDGLGSHRGAGAEGLNKMYRYLTKKYSTGKAGPITDTNSKQFARFYVG